MKISHPSFHEPGAGPAAGEPPHEHRHRLRELLFEIFTLPLLVLSPGVEMPAPMPAQIVQIAPSTTQKAAETQRLETQVRAHQSGLGDPEHAARRESLVKAIETVAELPEKVSDRQEAIQSVLDIYAHLERERGKEGEEVAESLQKLRELQGLA
jgi:hypothetical protein